MVIDLIGDLVISRYINFISSLTGREEEKTPRRREIENIRRERFKISAQESHKGNGCARETTGGGSD